MQRPPSVANASRVARLRCSAKAATTTTEARKAVQPGTTTLEPKQDQNHMHAAGSYQEQQQPQAQVQQAVLPQPKPAAAPVQHRQQAWGGLAGAVLPAARSAVKAVAGAVKSVDPRVRALVALNAMTLLMGTNWVVIKESNDAFDPVRMCCSFHV